MRYQANSAAREAARHAAHGRYHADERHRAHKLARARAYRQTPEGRAAKARGDLRYRSSEHGRQVIAASGRKRHTGFDALLVARLREAQRGLCALCSGALQTIRKAHDHECADHCHATGRPRGLLCNSCNTALGLYEKRQRPAGLRIEPYERYLSDPPASRIAAGSAANF